MKKLLCYGKQIEPDVKRAAARSVARSAAKTLSACYQAAPLCSMRIREQ